jgi:hypothetical protein
MAGFVPPHHTLTSDNPVYVNQPVEGLLIHVMRHRRMEQAVGHTQALEHRFSRVQAFPVNRRNFVRWCDLFQETGSTPGAALFSDYQKGLPGAKSGKFTVRAVAEIITL